MGLSWLYHNVCKQTRTCGGGGKYVHVVPCTIAKYRPYFYYWLGVLIYAFVRLLHDNLGSATFFSQAMAAYS